MKRKTVKRKIVKKKSAKRVAKTKSATYKKRLAALAKARAAKKVKTAPKKVEPKKVKAVTKKVDGVVGMTNEIYKPIQVGRTYALQTQTGDIQTKIAGVTKAKIKKAISEKKVLRASISKQGKKSFKLVDQSEFKSQTIEMSDSTQEAFETHEKLVSFIHENSLALVPNGVFISPLTWKYLIRSAVRGKNIMMLGPTGCGKTMLSKALVTALNRPDFYFNLGATQDPRATLIGNTHFDKKSGTFFSESAFVKAIETPNAIILLDELSRAHPEAWNILMTVLDENQRYLRLDEAEGSPIVKVAKGVTFVATANVGNEYTSTRIMDRALNDRFVTIEMNPLNKDDEFKLLEFKFPKADSYDLNALAEIAAVTRTMVKTADSKVSTIVSTRTNVEAAGLIFDGFSLLEAAEIAILPHFSADGELDSERTFVKQLVQKYVRPEPVKAGKKINIDDGVIDDGLDGQQINW